MVADKFAYIKALRGQRDLTPAEFQLLVIVWSYTDGAGRHARPGTNRLAGDLGHSGDRRVRRMLTTLVEKGYLAESVAGGGRGRATEYELVQPVNPGQENPGHLDPPFTNPGQTEHRNPGHLDPKTGVNTTPPSGLDQIKDQGDAGSGEADAPPPSPVNIPWSEYTDGCRERHLTPKRLEWMIAGSKVPASVTDPVVARTKFWAHVDRYNSGGGGDWMNRTDRASHGRHDVVSPDGRVSEEDSWDV